RVFVMRTARGDDAEWSLEAVGDGIDAGIERALCCQRLDPDREKIVTLGGLARDRVLLRRVGLRPHHVDVHLYGPIFRGAGFCRSRRGLHRVLAVLIVLTAV